MDCLSNARVFRGVFGEWPYPGHSKVYHSRGSLCLAANRISTRFSKTAILFWLNIFNTPYINVDGRIANKCPFCAPEIVQEALSRPRLLARGKAHKAHVNVLAAGGLVAVDGQLHCRAGLEQRQRRPIYFQRDVSAGKAAVR
jgi:hypothetical protein